MFPYEGTYFSLKIDNDNVLWSSGLGDLYLTSVHLGQFTNLRVKDLGDFSFESKLR